MNEKDNPWGNANIRVAIQASEGRVLGYHFHHPEGMTKDAAKALVAEAVGLLRSTADHQAAGSVEAERDDTYANGPEGMPRVRRMSESTLDSVIRLSRFDCMLSDESQQRLYSLLHDVAEETLARVPSWPTAALDSRAQPVAAGELPKLPEPWQGFQLNTGYGDWEQVTRNAINEPHVTHAYTADQMRAYGQQCADSRPAAWSALANVVGCFRAAEVEGLSVALQETPDERLKDLVERRLMHALHAAESLAPRTYRDGDQICAVWPDFIDLQASPAGFGATDEEAIADLCRADSRPAGATCERADAKGFPLCVGACAKRGRCDEAPAGSRPAGGGADRDAVAAKLREFSDWLTQRNMEATGDWRAAAEDAQQQIDSLIGELEGGYCLACDGAYCTAKPGCTACSNPPAAPGKAVRGFGTYWTVKAIEYQGAPFTSRREAAKDAWDAATLAASVAPNDELSLDEALVKRVTDAYAARFPVPAGYAANEVIGEVVGLIERAASAALPAARVMSSASTYENGPEGMPRVERMPYAVLDCIIDHSLFRYQGGALEGEDRDRLYALLHDTAEEVLARVPSWPAASAAQPGAAQLPDCAPLYSTRLKAKRYDWLRDQGCNFVWAEIGAGNFREGLDKAIDEAMARAAAPTNDKG